MKKGKIIRYTKERGIYLGERMLDPATVKAQWDSGMIDDDSLKVVQLEVTAKNWEFVPETIEVIKGQTVILKIRSIDVEHGIKIPEFGQHENHG